MFTKLLRYVFGQWTAEQKKDRTLCINNGGKYEEHEGICLTLEDQQALYLVLQDVNGW